MSENIVHTAILDDCFRLMEASNEICAAFKETGRAQRDFARLGSITRWGDRFTFSLLEDFRARWADRSADDRLEPKLAFVLGWLCHRAADRQMKPVFREAEPDRTAKPSDCSIYHEAFIFHEVFQSGTENPYHAAIFERGLEALPASAHIDPVAAEELLRVLMQRALIEMHTFIPDPDDIEGWFEKLFARQQNFYVDLERYAAAVANPDPDKVRRFITEVNFYDRAEPIIEVARSIQHTQQGDWATVKQAVQAEANSHYAQALKMGYGYLKAASDFFSGDMAVGTLREQLDIGKKGRDGLVV